MLKNDPKRFWKTINPNQLNLISLLDNSGNSVSEMNCADVLNNSFSAVFNHELADNLPDVPYLSHTPMQSIIFDPHGIAKVIDSLSNSSSMGIDGINAKILKNTKHISSILLSLLFQQSLDTGYVPDDWRIGKITPIFKKGDRSSPNNYRPISITSVSSKIMEHVLYTHIVSFLSSLNFFHPNQHGFRKDLSCDTQLALFLHDLHSYLDKNIPVDALFLDFEKAFDKVPHARLLLKLSRLNLHPDVLNWIQNFLTHRKQFVHVNSHSSCLSPVLSGVPQGTVLGPLLFLIYINDLPLTVSSAIRLFADDCVIYRPILTSDDTAILQQDLFNIQEWCLKWLMKINISKSSLVSFHRRRNYINPTYVCNNAAIVATDSFKYLGIIISHDLTWTHHINYITNSANRALGFLRRNLTSAPTAIKLLAYKTFVLPKLEYASAVFDPHQANLTHSIESIQNRAARFILSVYSFRSSISALKTQLQLPSLESRRHISRLCLYHRFFYSLPPNNQIIVPAHRISRHSHPNAVYVPRTLTTTFQRSFFIFTAHEWNNLSTNIATITSHVNFKSAILNSYLD